MHTFESERKEDMFFYLKKGIQIILFIIFLAGLFFIFKYDSPTRVLFGILVCLISIFILLLMTKDIQTSPLLELGVVKECGSLDCEIAADIEFFEDAKSIIKIVSTGLEENYFDDSSIRKTLQETIDKGVKIIIAFNKLKGFNINRNFLKWGLSRKIEFYKIDDKIKLKKHLVIVDGKHIRVEKAHKPNQIERKNCLYFDQPDYAEIGEKSFEKIINEESSKIINENDI